MSERIRYYSLIALLVVTIPLWIIPFIVLAVACGGDNGGEE